jgi:signal recognition particle subunit SRP54
MSSLQGLGKDYIFWKTSNYLLNTKDKTTYWFAWYLSSAIQQLYVVGDSIGVEVYSSEPRK